MTVKVSFSKGCLVVPESLVPVLNTFIENYVFEATVFQARDPFSTSRAEHRNLKVAIYSSSEENSAAMEQSVKRSLSSSQGAQPPTELQPRLSTEEETAESESLTSFSSLRLLEI